MVDHLSLYERGKVKNRIEFMLKISVSFPVDLQIVLVPKQFALTHTSRPTFLAKSKNLSSTTNSHKTDTIATSSLFRGKEVSGNDGIGSFLFLI
jgi:hypothetical protein